MTFTAYAWHPTGVTAHTNWGDILAAASDRSAILWIDFDGPEADELEPLEKLGISHLTIEDMAKQGQRAKLELFETYAFLVMHAISYADDRITVAEVDIVFNNRLVATVHRGPLACAESLRANEEQLRDIMRRGADFLVYALVERLVDSYFPVLDAIDDAIDDLEDQIVTRASNDLMRRIFDLKRDVTELRKRIGPLLEIFSRLAAYGTEYVQAEHSVYFRDIHDHLIRIFEIVDSYRDLMSGALDAYLSTVSNQMNAVMKRLTLVATLLLPATVITGAFGMNLDGVAFAIVLAMLVLSAPVGYFIFRRLGWI